MDEKELETKVEEAAEKATEKVTEEATETKASISNSKAKREARKIAAQKEKRDKLIGQIVGIVIGVLVVAAIVALIAVKVVAASKQVVSSNDFGSALTENGFVKGVNAQEVVTLPADYLNIKVPYAEIEYTDEQIEQDIASQLSSHQTVDSETDKLLEDGDRASIDYVGSIDGVEFEGGSATDAPLSIGSHMFIDDFEEQLIGLGVGDEKVVEVTFPEDYSSADLAGKDAQFNVTIKGIYTDPEFNDEFVAEYLSEQASTTDEYREYLRTTNEETNLDNYLNNYILENSSVSKLPKSYLKKMKQNSKYMDEYALDTMNQMYQAYYGTNAANSVLEYMEMTEEEYMTDLQSRSEDTVKENLIYQAILEKAGKSYTIDDYKIALINENGSEDEYSYQAELYGDNYLVQSYNKDMAMELVKSGATIEGK